MLPTSARSTTAKPPKCIASRDAASRRCAPNTRPTGSTSAGTSGAWPAPGSRTTSTCTSSRAGTATRASCRCSATRRCCPSTCSRRRAGCAPTSLTLDTALLVSQIPAVPRRLLLRVLALTAVAVAGLAASAWAANIHGTAHNDLLRGTPGNDAIRGLAGNDRIYGLGGNDKLYGGPGNDHLYGGPGNHGLLGRPRAAT